MRWLQSLSFSSSSSSSSSSACPEKNCKESHNNKNFMQCYSFGFRLGVSKLTRPRELRRVKDQEVAPTKEVTAPPLSTSYHTPLSSPTSSFRGITPALPVPLPLPRPVPEGDGEQRLSPKEVGLGKVFEDRDKEKADGTPPNSSVFACRGSWKTAAHAKTRSMKGLSQEMIIEDSFEDEFRANVPIRSAPASPSSSHAVISPQSKSAGDMFPHHMFSTSNQAWSAPEMSILGTPGVPPIAFYDYGGFSSENTPFHSPPNRSPHQRQSSHSGPTSPIQQRVSPDISPSRLESNGHINVHPLPLPPGAAIACTSASITQVTTNPDPLPMNCQWQKGKLIGRGTFGSVYVASNRETGALCAMKEVEICPDDPKSAECIKQLEQEIKVLSHLKHPNIVQYYGSEIAEDKFYIYLEYVHPGSINKYVRDHYGAITESVIRNFTRHILSGLAYLHSTKTIHRDIKGANLLVDASGVVKLADFGMSKHLSGQRAELSLKGSPYWMAPELLQAVMQKDNRSELALAVDIWSLGCTIIEMYTGKAPWSEYEGAAAMFKVLRDTPPTPETLSPEGKDFLRCCFQRYPADRPSASMLLEHRFIKNPNSRVSHHLTDNLHGR